MLFPYIVFRIYLCIHLSAPWNSDSIKHRPTRTHNNVPSPLSLVIRECFSKTTWFTSPSMLPLRLPSTLSYLTSGLSASSTMSPPSPEGPWGIWEITTAAGFRYAVMILAFTV